MKYVFIICSILSLPVGLVSQIFAQPEYISTHTTLFSDLNDIDHDGDLDMLIVESCPDVIVARENDGQGNFGPKVILKEVLVTFETVYEDFDLDGDIDVFYDRGAGSADSLGWFENIGFESMIYHPLDSFINDFKSAFVHDFTHDGLPDLFVMYEDSSIVIHENSVGGDFSSSHVVYSGEQEFNRIRIADIDLDDEMDIVLGNYGENTVFWKKNLGNFEFTEIEVLINYSNYVPSSDSFEDMDNDGDSDLIVYESDIFGYIENVDGVFLEADTIIIEQNSIGRTANYYLDIDDDGDRDIIIPTPYEGLYWIENFDYESYSEPKLIFFGNDNVPWFSMIFIFHINFIDVDFDGKKDLLVSSKFPTVSPTGSHTWFKNIQGESCADPLACNFNPQAISDDGTCCYSECGCTDELALNYSPSALCNSNVCVYLPGDFNGDGYITSADLTIFLSSFGLYCEDEEFCLSDFTNDGAITSADLTAFLSYFNQ